MFQRGDSAEKSLSGGIMTTDVKYDFEPYDGKPGESYDRFERRLMNAGSKTDDRGFSYADHLSRRSELRRHFADLENH